MTIFRHNYRGQRAITVREAAPHFGVGHSAVRKWIERHNVETVFVRLPPANQEETAFTESLYHRAVALRRAQGFTVLD